MRFSTGVLLAGPDSVVFGRSVEESREKPGRLLARRIARRCRPGGFRFPISGVAGAIG